MCKLADDTSLLVPSNSAVSLADEFNNVKHWALENRMTINMQKTKEIVFHRPTPRTFLYPVPVNSIEQVTSAKLLDVILHESLRFDEHVRYINGICVQRMYLLNDCVTKALQLTNVILFLSPS